MKLGMTMPVMEPALDAQTLESWARAIDEGPFSSLSFGERMAFDNPETLTLLGAVAAWTKRVEVITTVVVPQLHNPVMLAKGLATADLLTGGRLTVGLGVGGRHEDYRAAGADPSTQRMSELADRALTMKRVWSGEKVTDAVLPVGPTPLQPGGPPFLVGTLGPRTMRSAVTWADGLAGVTMDLDIDAVTELFDVARDAWREAGRSEPRLITSTWFAIDDGDGSAKEQMTRHIRRYMNWLPADLVESFAGTVGFAGTVAELRELRSKVADTGADEFILIPTSSDLGQLHAAAEAA